MSIFSRCHLLLIFISTFLITQVSYAANKAIFYDLKKNPPVHRLTDKILMQFIASDQFTVIQWVLRAGGKLMPMHKHINEQVTRVLKGDVEVHTGNEVLIMHEGDVMVFPPNVTHGFIALTDAIIYEQQTPIRKDFLELGFIDRLSKLLTQNQ